MHDGRYEEYATSDERLVCARFKDRRHCHWAAHVPSGVARIDRTRRKPYGAPGRAVGVGYPIDNSLLIRKYDPYTRTARHSVGAADVHRHYVRHT
jgi:hypothetical protein